MVGHHRDQRTRRGSRWAQDQELGEGSALALAEIDGRNAAVGQGGLELLGGRELVVGGVGLAPVIAVGRGLGAGLVVGAVTAGAGGIGAVFGGFRGGGMRCSSGCSLHSCCA